MSEPHFVDAGLHFGEAGIVLQDTRLKSEHAVLNFEDAIPHFTDTRLESEDAVLHFDHAILRLEVTISNFIVPVFLF